VNADPENVYGLGSALNEIVLIHLQDRTQMHAPIAHSPNHLTRQEWAKHISDAWRESNAEMITGIFQTGHDLITAKEELDHGEFQAMVKHDLPFSPRTARMLMTITRDDRLQNGTMAPFLPPSWRTLYEISRLPDQDLYYLRDTGVIHPNVQRKEIVAARKASKRREQNKKLIRQSTAFPNRRYNVILADPPWKFDAAMTQVPEEVYPTMTTEDICKLPVADLATPDAVLFLWVPSSLLKKSWLVMESWGFEFVTDMVWVKDRVGMGRVVLQQHEPLLLARQGTKIDVDPYARPASVIEAPRGRHSKKPEQVYEIIEKMFPELAKIELFARSRRAGWDAWGNEVDDEILMAAE
jgi:N6-adenosine-specific RNA methylase IME4